MDVKVKVKVMEVSEDKSRGQGQRWKLGYIGANEKNGNGKY